jgi:hypothetical protein
VGLPGQPIPRREELHDASVTPIISTNKAAANTFFILFFLVVPNNLANRQNKDTNLP